MTRRDVLIPAAIGATCAIAAYAALIAGVAWAAHRSEDAAIADCAARAERREALRMSTFEDALRTHA